MSISYTKEQLETRYRKLPSVLQDALFSVEVANRIFEIGKKHGLEMNKISILAEEVGLVILGITRPSEFIQKLTQALQMEMDKARPIASEINHQVFFPLREALKKTHNTEFTEDEMQKGAEVRSEINLRPPQKPFIPPPPSLRPSVGVATPPSRVSPSAPPQNMPRETEGKPEISAPLNTEAKPQVENQAQNPEHKEEANKSLEIKARTPEIKLPETHIPAQDVFRGPPKSSVNEGFVNPSKKIPPIDLRLQKSDELARLVPPAASNMAPSAPPAPPPATSHREPPPPAATPPSLNTNPSPIQPSPQKSAEHDPYKEPIG